MADTTPLISALFLGQLHQNNDDISSLDERWLLQQMERINIVKKKNNNNNK